MTRFVLDTSILVSIALPGSRLGSLVGVWQGGRGQLLISTEIFEEYLRVLTYPRFRLSSEDIRRILEKEVLPYAERVRVTSSVEVIAEDPSDNKFLACAVDGRADWVVIGDKHLLKRDPFRGIQIGTPAQFLAQL